MSNIQIAKSQFDKARTYLYSSGRELEQARFEFHFANGSKEAVMEKLGHYQNDDGGLGKGLEPDFWLPLSSPMATWAAGQILYEIGAESNEQMVKSMISYLVNTFDIETGMWDSVLPENNDYPHAPWWHWTEGIQKNWMFNPSVELAAYLVHWSSEQSKASDYGWISLEKAVTHLMNKTEMDRHEINNYQQFIKIIRPYESTFNNRTHYSLNIVSDKVLKLAEQCVDKDISNWLYGYKALPLDFVDSGEHPLSERFGSLVEENLKFYCEQMSDEGIWDISWSWGSYQDEFEVAKRYWKGILAVNRYKQLKAFGSLE